MVGGYADLALSTRHGSCQSADDVGLDTISVTVVGISLLSLGSGMHRYALVGIVIALRPFQDVSLWHFHSVHLC